MPSFERESDAVARDFYGVARRTMMRTRGISPAPGFLGWDHLPHDERAVWRAVAAHAIRNRTRLNSHETTRS